ncbi:MAG: hypothetical protein O9350_20265, partial [Microcystis sp. LE19-388.1G]|nr:hypothetical protein [Microcystis sp. LE19-388.1G]
MEPAYTLAAEVVIVQRRVPTPLSKTAHWLPVAPVPKVQGDGFVATSGPVVFSNPSTPGVG